MKCFVCNTDYNVRLYINDKSKYNNEYLCQKHINQLKNNNRIRDNKPPVIPKNLRTCDICESKHDVIHHKDEYLCRRHYSQLRLYGKILDRTKFDKNEIIITQNYAEVNLYNSRNEFVTTAKIDVDDVEKVEKYKWGFDSKNGYSITYDNGKYLSMHQLIMNSKDTDVIIDHIDRNKLNNQKHNLRKVDKSINAINTGVRKSNSSGVTGVSYSEKLSKWRSYISYKGERIELGQFKDIDSAIKARLLAELKYYPENPPQKELFKKHNIGRELFDNE